MHDQQWYDVAFIQRKCRNLPVSRNSENMLTHARSPFLFFRHGFIQIRFGLTEFFF